MATCTTKLSKTGTKVPTTITVNPAVIERVKSDSKIIEKLLTGGQSPLVKLQNSWRTDGSIPSHYEYTNDDLNRWLIHTRNVKKATESAISNALSAAASKQRVEELTRILAIYKADPECKIKFMSLAFPERYKELSARFIMVSENKAKILAHCWNELPVLIQEQNMNIEPANFQFPTYEEYCKEIVAEQDADDPNYRIITEPDSIEAQESIPFTSDELLDDESDDLDDESEDELDEYEDN